MATVIDEPKSGLDRSLFEHRGHLGEVGPAVFDRRDGRQTWRRNRAQ